MKCLNIIGLCAALSFCAFPAFAAEEACQTWEDVATEIADKGGNTVYVLHLTPEQTRSYSEAYSLDFPEGATAGYFWNWGLKTVLVTYFNAEGCLNQSSVKTAEYLAHIMKTFEYALIWKPLGKNS